MEKTLRMLIEDDIKITRLVQTLGKLEIDASYYLTNTSTVVFRLAGIPLEGHEDHRFDDYFKMIERCASRPASPDQLKKQAVEIVQIILNWQKEYDSKVAS